MTQTPKAAKTNPRGSRQGVEITCTLGGRAAQSSKSMRIKYSQSMSAKHLRKIIIYEQINPL